MVSEHVLSALFWELRFCSSWRAKLNLEMKHVELSASATLEICVFWDVRLDHEYVFNWFWCGWVLEFVFWCGWVFWSLFSEVIVKTFFCVVFDAGKVFVQVTHTGNLWYLYVFVHFYHSNKRNMPDSKQCRNNLREQVIRRLETHLLRFPEVATVVECRHTCDTYLIKHVCFTDAASFKTT